MEKLRKDSFIDYKCHIRSCVHAIILTQAPKQNLIMKVKNLGYLNFSTILCMLNGAADLFDNPQLMSTFIYDS